MLMSDKEFLKCKEAYVEDVLRILDRKADEEANLIFRRHRAAGGKQLYTDISAAISEEINGHYEKLFSFFQEKSHLVDEPLFAKVLLNHLPAFIQDHPRVSGTGEAIAHEDEMRHSASEIASSIVYHGGWDDDLEAKLQRYLLKG